ncbi:Na+/H+ antiporter NhaC [Natrinema gelatinilyticum]|uniref:Na+/H+ antiporter NhaC n=1 Tax=Natrinema gelatinilyticum TaxID=2961571 RepID=UPI0020C2CEBE|nr:Na+/H+ antiporter NhaC [Natrinema gelatinilyticum]
MVSSSWIQPPEEQITLESTPVGLIGGSLILLVSLLILVIGSFVYQISTTILLMTVSIFTTSAYVFYYDFSWENMLRYGTTPLIGRITNVLLILMLIGALIGIWMISGTIPYLMYVGIQVLSPEFFLVSTALIVSVGALVTGTSFGSGATFGVALIGVAQGLGVPLPQTAGAVVMGAFFGDKLSPLSDTTVLAAGVSETDLFDHIRSMLYTTIPGYVIGLVVFLAIGMQYGGSAEPENIAAMTQGLQEAFSLSPILLVPPVVLLVLSYRQYSTVPVLWIAILTAIPLAVYQGYGITEIAGAMAAGPEVSTGVDTLNELLTRGGIESMTNIITVLLFAFLFAGQLEYTQTIGVIAKSIRERFVRDDSGRLIFVTSLTSILGTLTTGAVQLSLIIPPIMYSKIYDRLEIDRTVLSRTIEDSGTVTAPIIPWNLAGLYFAGILGVPTLAYAPWTFICYLGPLFAWLYGFTDTFVFETDAHPDTQ